MSTQAIAVAFTQLCAKGEFDQAGAQFWADDIVSIEAMAGDMARSSGRAAVLAKGAWWYANHEIHGVTVHGPYVNGDQFVVRFTLDVTPKGGARVSMDEIALYTVRDAKIAEERFLPYSG